ncbi:MAG: hypothetical protein COV79_01215, partial [Parcubacteria group bacterium CG11_big_fil_rev_8_21_14_0_20_41_14]
MNQNFTGVKILITGANGFIGSRLTHYLVCAGAQVNILLDKSSSTDRLKDILQNITIHRCDKWDERSLKDLISTINPSIIFHLRAQINPNSVDESNDVFYKTNVIDTLTLAHAVISSNIDIKKFIHAGTIAEYGATSAPFREDKIAEPISAYGETKLKATKELLKIWQKNKFPATILRFSVVYGPGQHTHEYLIPNIIQNCISKKDFHINNPG